MLLNLIFDLLQLLAMVVTLGICVILVTIVVSIVYMIVKNVWHTATEDKENGDGTDI